MSLILCYLDEQNIKDMMNDITTLLVPKKVGMCEQVLDVLARYQCKVELIRACGAIVDFYGITGVKKLSMRERRHLLWDLAAIGVEFLAPDIVIG